MSASRKPWFRSDPLQSDARAIQILASAALATALWAAGPSGAFGDSEVQCPAGVESGCSPHRVGTMVICSSGEVLGYKTISQFCLSCHAGLPAMGIRHPYEVKYPESVGFRERRSLNPGIELNAGYLTCRSCHGGEDPANHFLVGHSGLVNVCNHCHVAAVNCPGNTGDPGSSCYPGRVHGLVRCYQGHEIVAHENTSAFCTGCHGGLERMARSHPVEVDYPRHRHGFIAAGSLDPDIRLENGRITCESCHQKRDQGMAVCVECHPK